MKEQHSKLTTTPQKPASGSHRLPLPSAAEQDMWYAYDVFTVLLEHQPQRAATFAAQVRTLARAYETIKQNPTPTTPPDSTG